MDSVGPVIENSIGIFLGFKCYNSREAVQASKDSLFNYQIGQEFFSCLPGKFELTIQKSDKYLWGKIEKKCELFKSDSAIIFGNNSDILKC